MAVTHSIQDGVLTMELVGTYLSADVIRQFLKALNDPKCPPRVALLMDVSRSESLAKRPTDEIRMVAEFLGSYSERVGGRCAVVASPDVHYGLSQMGSVFSESVGITARVFRTKNEAIDWLTAAPAQQE
jgi:hypothetical protein